MAKQRIQVPAKTKALLLKEFNNSCAACGRQSPNIDHIDENPSNNDLWNLLPLCPNCHLIDRHNPTAPIDKGKLRLLRRYKDPTVLHPKFEPLFRRLKFLDDIADDTAAMILETKAIELVRFVQALEMGTFYGNQLNEMLQRQRRIYVVPRDVGPAADKHMREEDQEYREQLRTAREQVYLLAVELLRYQNWNGRKDKEGG